MSTPVGTGSAPPIAVEVVRGGHVESVHRAHVAVVDTDGEVLASAGDPHVAIYPRSALKPLFAVAMLNAGLQFSRTDHLALAASSHSGEPIHVETVHAMLAEVGCSKADLANTPGWPYDERARIAWIAAGGDKTREHANCSGKHAAMLATCVVNGWPITGYTQPGHPLVSAIASGLASEVGVDLAPPAIDGCGAPVWLIPLAALATGFARLANAAPGTSEQVVADAMRTHPEFVGGTRRDVTVIMRNLPGVVAKDGADGVYAAGLPDGRGVAVKVEDGGTRAMPATVAAALIAAGMSADALTPVLEWEKVLGGGEPAGEMRARITLTSATPHSATTQSD